MTGPSSSRLISAEVARLAGVTRAAVFGDVPVIDLLDESVDLTPAAHLSAGRSGLAEEYAGARAGIHERAARTAALRPELPAGDGTVEGGTLRIADLARAGLVDIDDKGVTSASDQLDTDCLRGFLRGPANAARGTSSSGLDAVARARDGLTSGTLRP